MKWEGHKYFCYVVKCHGSFKEKICEIKFLLYRMIDRSNIAIQNWLFDKSFIKTKRSEPVTCGKTIVFVTNDKIQTFKGKLEFGGSGIPHHKLEAWILKDSSDEIIGDIDKCDFDIEWWEGSVFGRSA